MAIANLHETVLNYKLRRNQLNLEITELESQKRLGTYSTADINSLLNCSKSEIRAKYKELYENSDELKEAYLDYTKMPDFEAEIEKIEALYQDQLNELTSWETAIDAQITTDSAELEEVNAYLESVQQMLSTNIQEDFNYGLNS